MSDDLSRRSAAGAEAEPIDRVIDQVAREMTDGALPADFRARVIARIGDHPSRRWRWTFAPIAAAALIIVAVFVARDRRHQTSALRESTAVAHLTPPSEVQRGSERATVDDPAPLRPTARLKPGPTYVPYSARAVNGAPAISEIEALAPPPMIAPPIEIETLAAEPIPIPEIDAIESIAVAPLGELQSTNDERPTPNDQDQ